MLWGITSERIESWLNPDPDEVVGVAASSGVVEGTARVLFDVAQIAELREGEILVVPVTAPSWAPVFAKIKAAVSDIGGSMSHAAIVAREYGMPAVVGMRRRDQADQDRRPGPGRRRPWHGPGAGGLTVAARRVTLADASRRRRGVGGKAASLGELSRAGVAVPPGFAVTTEAFTRRWPRWTRRRAARRDRGPRSPATWPGSRPAARRVPRAHRGRAAARRGRGGDRGRRTRRSAPAAAGDPDVAVRSSATVEDSAEASFAGLQDTYLGVSGAAAVLDHVRRCWASLYNDESVAYRRRLRPARGRRGHGGRGAAHGRAARRGGDVHQVPGHRRPLGGRDRGHLGPRLRARLRRRDARLLGDLQDHRRDHHPPRLRQAQDPHATSPERRAWLRPRRRWPTCRPGCGTRPA